MIYIKKIWRKKYEREIGGFKKETEDERLKRIEETRMKIMGLPVDEEVKMGMINIFDNSIVSDEIKEKSR